MSLAVVACSDDDYSAGAPAPESGEKVYFAASNDNKYVLALDESEITLTLTREDATEEATIPVKLSTGAQGIFSAPSSVTFKAGETEAKYLVTISDKMEAFKTYTFQVRVPEAYTNAYKDQAQVPMFDVTVIKEDYKVIATGVYTDLFWYEDAWEQDLEYSPMKNIYRWPDLFANGTPIYFLFDGKNFQLCNADGVTKDANKNPLKMATGMIHSTYGPVSITQVMDAEYGYDTEDLDEGVIGEFYFKGQFTVSAGSFGSGYNVFDVFEWYEKPWEAGDAE